MFIKAFFAVEMSSPCYMADIILYAMEKTVNNWEGKRKPCLAVESRNTEASAARNGQRTSVESLAR
jgi:hypothetical protein